MGRDRDCEGKKWVYTEISHGQAPQTHCHVFDNLNCQHLSECSPTRSFIAETSRSSELTGHWPSMRH